MNQRKIFNTDQRIIYSGCTGLGVEYKFCVFTGRKKRAAVGAKNMAQPRYDLNIDFFPIIVNPNEGIYSIILKPIFSGCIDIHRAYPLLQGNKPAIREV